MRHWTRMVAGGAATLIAVGAAGAAERMDGRAAPAQRVAIGRVETGERFRTAGVAVDDSDARVAGCATVGELQKVYEALLERLDGERRAPAPAPTFTDAG